MNENEQQGEGADPELGQLQRALASVYKVERLLSRRGTSVIYQAEEINPPRPIALRIFPSEMNLGGVATAFKEAAQVAVRLSHANVVPLYRIGMRAGAPFFVAMKLVEGRTLQEIVETQGALHIPLIVAALRSIAAGLAYAHGRGAVHGALTGGVVLVDRNGHVAVSEFATARVIEDGVAASTGKLRAATPEEAAGGTAGAPGDQYALGMLVLELLTGEPASAADPLATDALASLQEVRTTRVAIPDQLVRVVETALAREPTNRFASMAHLLSAVEAIPFSDADEREASVVLGRLARGETVPKVRAAAAPPPKPPVGAPLGPRASAPGAAPTEVRPKVLVPPTPPAATPAAAAPPPPPAEPVAAAPPPPRTATPPRPRPALAPTPAVAPEAEEEPSAPAPPAEPAPPAIRRPSRPTPAASQERVRPTGAPPVLTAPESARGSRLPLAIAAVVAVVVLGAGGYLVLGRHRAASPPPAPEASAPAAQPAPSVAVAPPTAAAAESAQADSARRAAAAADSARVDSLRAAAPRTGELAFNVEPTTATIAIDGKPSGSGGIVDSQVTAGSRHLTISAPGFTTLDTVVAVRPNTPLDLGEITLQASARADSARTTGVLRLTTVPPTAQIFVEGQLVGTGSLADFQLSPGHWHLKISAPGYADYDTVVAVTSGARVRLGQITLKSGGP